VPTESPQQPTATTANTWPSSRSAQNVGFLRDQVSRLTCRGSGPGDQLCIPHASASSSRLSARASSPGPGSAWMRLLATTRPASRRSRFSSAFGASRSARGTLTVSDASALTRNSLRLSDLNPSLDQPRGTIGKHGQADVATACGLPGHGGRSVLPRLIVRWHS
jgi:hypothetical protein